MKKVLENEHYTLKAIKEHVSQTIDDLLKHSISDRGLTTEEFEKKTYRKEKLNSAQKKCGLGDISAKSYMKSFILDFLSKSYGFDENNINYVIRFNKDELLNAQDKFEILLYSYKKKFKYYALLKLLNHYHMDELREASNGEVAYWVSDEMISEAYALEKTELNYEDKLNIITQRVYQELYGLGVIDEIRDMYIEGVSGGVSGLPEDYVTKMEDIEKEEINALPKAYDSIWIMLDGGRSILFEFLSFGSFAELQRVCGLIYRYNDPGQLSQSKGYMKNTMADGSRIVVTRPPFSESWMFWIRKYDLPNYALEEVVHGENKEIVLSLLSFAMKGELTTAITGMQFAGKTVLLIALIAEIYAYHNLRIWEEFFEARLRRIYPRRNIASFQQTADIPGNIGIDLLKKTDGAVTIIQEVAEDPVAAYMLAIAQVASRFTIFGHHAKDFDALVRALRNSALNTELFSNESIAEQQVISVLELNIHLNRLPGQKERFIERITECIPSKDNRTYEAVNIVEYNLDKGMYEIKNCLSDEKIGKMNQRMLPEDQRRFKEFLLTHFNKEIEL